MAAPSVLPHATSRKGSTERLRGILLFLAAAIAAFVLYRPDTNAPFEIIDFSETLPFLTERSNFGDRFVGLMGYYLGHGRAAVGLSAGLAAKWTLFEWWTPGWQWTRFVVGILMSTLAWNLFRVLGANRHGASLGASLFIVSEAVAPGWLRPSVNEPFGTVLLLVASLVACQYQSTVRPGRMAVTIAALLAAMVLVKETLVATALFPIAVALCRGASGLLAWPARSRRNALLLLATSGALTLAVVPVAWALTQAAPEGYARQFGSGSDLFSNALFGLIPALIPFTPVSNPPGWAVLVADVAWIVMLMAGLRMADESKVRRTHWRLLIPVALALPVARMVVYLPWPLQYPYYSIPYVTGIALIVSLGFTRMTQGRGMLRLAAVVLAAAVVLYAASAAHAQASRYFALRTITDALIGQVHMLHRNGTTDTVYVAVPTSKEQAWWGLGPTMARFGVATGRPFPPVREVSCLDADSLAKSRLARTALTVFAHHCSLGQRHPSDLTILVRRVDLARLRLATDTLRAVIFRPGAS